LIAGGYESGYQACPCFWGETPGSLVRRLISANKKLAGLKVLDVGCGEGKNAQAFAAQGCSVDAIDCSSLAIKNGQTSFQHPLIRWQVADVSVMPILPLSYDIIVAYGLLH
jgi:tellurite methyltransferase